MSRFGVDFSRRGQWHRGGDGKYYQRLVEYFGRDGRNKTVRGEKNRWVYRVEKIEAEAYLINELRGKDSCEYKKMDRTHCSWFWITSGSGLDERLFMPRTAEELDEMIKLYRITQ